MSLNKETKQVNRPSMIGAFSSTIFLKKSIINILLDLDLDCLLAMSLILYAFSARKALIPFALWQDYKLLHHHQTNFLLMEWENLPGFQCTHMYWLLEWWFSSLHVFKMTYNPISLFIYLKWYSFKRRLCLTVQSTVYPFFVYKYII